MCLRQADRERGERVREETGEPEQRTQGSLSLSHVSRSLSISLSILHLCTRECMCVCVRVNGACLCLSPIIHSHAVCTKVQDSKMETETEVKQAIERERRTVEQHAENEGDDAHMSDGDDAQMSDEDNGHDQHEDNAHAEEYPLEMEFDEFDLGGEEITVPLPPHFNLFGNRNEIKHVPSLEQRRDACACVTDGNGRIIALGGWQSAPEVTHKSVEIGGHTHSLSLHAIGGLFVYLSRCV